MENNTEILRLKRGQARAAAEIAAQATEAYTENQLAECADNDTDLPLALFCNGRLCGIAVFQTAADEAELHAITVDRAFRGRHLGLALLQEGISLLKKKGIKSVFLEVRNGNAAARGLYEKCGFYSCGIRRAFYKNPPDDAVIMRADI